MNCKQAIASNLTPFWGFMGLCSSYWTQDSSEVCWPDLAKGLLHGLLSLSRAAQQAFDKFKLDFVIGFNILLIECAAAGIGAWCSPYLMQRGRPFALDWRVANWRERWRS